VGRKSNIAGYTQTYQVGKTVHYLLYDLWGDLNEPSFAILKFTIFLRNSIFICLLMVLCCCTSPDSSDSVIWVTNNVYGGWSCWIFSNFIFSDRYLIFWITFKAEHYLWGSLLEFSLYYALFFLVISVTILPKFCSFANSSTVDM